MCRWRVSVALTLGLLWCFSDCTRALVQCVLCFLLCFSTPRLLRDIRRESGTQTDEEAKEATLQEIAKDLPDGEYRVQAEPLESQYPHVRKSLHQAFECAYTRLLLPWYDSPEPSERQPLHRLLSQEFDFVIDRVIERATDFDVCQVAVGSIRILTQHLHNSKQPTRELPLGSRADEVAVLRGFSDVLVRNLFSSSLGGPEVNRCVLNEILAVKGLGLLVTWLSDPDNLNQLVVSQLDSVTSRGSEEDLSGSGQGRVSLDPRGSKGDGGEGGFQGEDASTRTKMKGKSRGQKLKEELSKWKDKMRIKRPKKQKLKAGQDLLRKLSVDCVSNEDDASSRESSIHSQEDSDRDSDLENYLTSQENMIEIKLSYEMWCVGHWAVGVPHAEWEDEDLVFGIHLAETNSPETLQWNIRKTYTDVVHFHNRWQDTNLPAVMELEDSQANDEVKENVRVSVQRFLQELVSDCQTCNTRPVFQFLCPLDKLLNEEEANGGVWGLLSGLANFLTPGQDEDGSPRTETPQELVLQSPHPQPSAVPSENSVASAEKDSEVTGASHPACAVCDCPSEVFEEGEAEMEAQPAVKSDSKSNESCPQEKLEDADNSFTFSCAATKEKCQSRESLVSRTSSNDDLLETDSCQKGAIEKEPVIKFTAKENKKDKWKFGGVNKAKEDVLYQKGQGSGENLDATKAMFDLLKEISGNSFAFNFVNNIFFKPVMPIVKMKVNSFLNKMKPTEERMAAYISGLRDKQGPESQPAAPLPPRTDEEKDETRERAHSLLSARCLGYLILKKTDVDSVFKLFQKREENKMLVYELLLFLLGELFPRDRSLAVVAADLQKVKKSS